MKSYMVHIGLPETLTQDFVELIPVQRLQINILMQGGHLSSYAVAMDRRTLWTIINAESAEGVRNIIATMPLNRFFAVDGIEELMFHEHAVPASQRFPAFSLN
jgi:hypothetical protein